MAIIDFGKKYSDKPLMIMLIGVPGSSKTTIAKELSHEYNAVVCSSDAKRKELYGDESTQGSPSEVFLNLHKDILFYLRTGCNVIYDATNVRRKNRESFLQFLKQSNVDCYRIAWVVAPPIEECLVYDQERERKVGKEVIMRMVQAFEFPQYFEGWNEILIWDHENSLLPYNRDLANQIDELMDNFDQKNPWHFEDLGHHSRRVQAWAYGKYDIKKSHINGVALQVAARYHDVGKLYTQTLDERGVAHYYGHPQVGAYFMTSHLELMPAMDLTMEDVYFILFLVNYHMFPFNFKEEKTTKKWKDKFGSYWFDALMLLHEADKEATSEEARSDTRRY